MATIEWSQDVFSKGELSPLMYSRVTVEAYYRGLKTARNVLTFPQGGAGKRFGTVYHGIISGVSDYTEIFFEAFPYLNECTYLLIFVPNFVYIYLEGILMATVATGYLQVDIENMDATILDNRFRSTTGRLIPKDLVRSASAANVIVSNTTTTITLTTALTAGHIYPIRFTNTGGALPTTSPQIVSGRTYFLYMTTTTTGEIYKTATDAKARTNHYTISAAGTGTNNVFVLNTWTFQDVAFKNLPIYDFGELNYSAVTFQPATQSGYGIQVVCSANIATTNYIGGAVIFNGGSARIVGIFAANIFLVDVIEPFTDTAIVPGTQVVLAEPVWSDARGWPSKCSSFQRRSIFANTDSLQNGIWLSAINDYNDYNDLLADDDDAISWYPSSDTVNAIQFIVPYRSLTVHTNTGIYSTPLSFETAITPSNFSLALQDSTPATAIQPRGIDNQIVIISGSDVHSMLWDGFNNSYTSNIASVVSEHLIDSPHDECAFTDLSRAGSRYMFIINDDGSLVVFQTLIAENVQGFTPQYLDQYYGNAYFRWATSDPTGRAWFVIEREIAEADAPIAISNFSPILNTLRANGSNFSTTSPTLIKFTTTGSLPTTTPQIEVDTWYWAVGHDVDRFLTYLTKEDAEAGENVVIPSSAGVNSNVEPWPLITNFFIEELSFDTYVDCAFLYDDVPSSSFGSLSRFNGQNVAIDGDGFGFSAVGDNSTIEITAHGEAVEISEAQIGFPIHTTMIPMPIALPGQVGNKGSSLVKPQHIRTCTLMYADSIGGYVNGKPIQYNNVENTIPGNPPTPTTGMYEFSPMKGWDDFRRPSVTITHSDPFPFKLIGLFYRIEV